MTMDLLEPPLLDANALEPVGPMASGPGPAVRAPRAAGALRHREGARRSRWPLWTSIALHAGVACVAIALRAEAGPAAPPTRAAEIGVLAPELLPAQEPEALPREELPEMLDLPEVQPTAPCEDPALCEPAPEPFGEPEVAVDAPEPALAVPTLTDARARVRPARPAPLAVAAPAAPPAPAAPAAPPAPPGPRRAAPAPTRAPDLPLDARLAALPRGLVATLVLTVEADGRVSDVRIETSSGAAVFDDAARAWVLSRWRFEASAQRFRTRVPFRLAPR